MPRFQPVFLLALLLVISCQPAQEQEETDHSAHLGVVSFSPSCNEEAAASFEEGLLLLHSFEYEDAREEFIAARNSDKDCVMAYWGEAMTYNHPLWSAQYTDEAREALARLGESKEARLAKAGTDLERDFLMGVEILYSEGEKLDRDKMYSEHMKGMYDKYSGNQEVSAFYALSLLGSSIERDVKTYERGARVVKGIIEENPQHPGALHYLIHAYDDPGHAQLALEAANAYSKVAPDAGHALHMPSHIYVALGMWDEVIASNIDSWNADAARSKRLKLDNDGLNYHALQWLMYGLLQKGRVDTARQLVDNMITYTEETPSARARAYLTYMRAGFLAETGDWADELTQVDVDDKDMNIVFPATNMFVKGMHALAQSDLESLETIIDSMHARSVTEKKKLMQRGSAMCSGVGWATQLPTQQDVNFARIMELELRALLADERGEAENAEQFFREATTLEDETSYAFGPPTVVKPSHELYGEWLFRNERYEDAIAEFTKALDKAPGRRISTAAKHLSETKSAAVL